MLPLMKEQLVQFARNPLRRKREARHMHLRVAVPVLGEKASCSRSAHGLSRSANETLCCRATYLNRRATCGVSLWPVMIGAGGAERARCIP